MKQRHDAWVVRTADARDAAEMVALLNPIIEAGSYTAMERCFSVEEQVAYVRAFPADGVFHVAVDSRSGRLVGMQDVTPLEESAWINGAQTGDISTFVALDSHGGGVGRALSEVTLLVARARGYRVLQAVIRADNPGAQGFYRSIGFIEAPGARTELLSTREVRLQLELAD